MLAKRIGGIEGSVADVAFPVGTVVSTRGDLVLHACLAGTFDHLVGNETVWVGVLDHAQDCVSV